MRKPRFFTVFSVCFIGLFLISITGVLYGQKHPSELTRPDPIKVTPPEPEIFEVGKGITVYFIEDDELPLVNMIGYFKGGSLYDPLDKLGLASLTATVMKTGGTAKMSGDEIIEVLGFLPAPLGIGAAAEAFSSSFQCLKRHFPRVLDIYRDILISPVFEQEKLDFAVDQWKTRIKTRWNNPGAIKTLLFNDFLVGHEAMRTISPQTLNNITREDLIEVHQKYFVPNNMAIAITGDISASEVKKQLDRIFDGWEPKKVKFSDLPKIENKSKPKIYYVYKDIPQANILIGHYVDIIRDHPDLHKLNIMSNVLGWGGLSSRLNQEIRVKRGWTYGISGGVAAARANGSFRISSSLKAESLGEALLIIKDVVKKMQTELITDEELERIKDSQIYKSVFTHTFPLNIVASQIVRKIQGRPQFDENERMAKIMEVTKEDVLEVAKKYINLDDLMMVIVGNKELFDKPLEEFGEVVEIDLEKLKEEDLADKKDEKEKRSLKKK